MRSVLVVVSVHHGNTRKVAKAMAEELQAVIVEPEEIHPKELLVYDLLGFGSGIFFGHFQKRLWQFVEKLPLGEGRKAFVFSTSGLGYITYNHFLEEFLKKKGFQVMSGFTCRGYDTFSILRIFGGLNRGRPNEKDLQAASLFAANLRKELES
ncbi:MAG: flavodoxin family protein [Candidatus Caldatribacteriaceae bacterium]